MILLETIVPHPDQLFWYVLSSVLGTILLAVVSFGVVRWINGVEAWMKKGDERFEALALEQVQHTQTLKAHSKALEINSIEIESNIKLAKEMTEMLHFMRTGHDGDKDNPTVKRMRDK